MVLTQQIVFPNLNQAAFVPKFNRRVIRSHHKELINNILLLVWVILATKRLKNFIFSTKFGQIFTPDS